VLANDVFRSVAVQKSSQAKGVVVVHAPQAHRVRGSDNRQLEPSNDASSCCAVQSESSNRWKSRGQNATADIIEKVETCCEAGNTQRTRSTQQVNNKTVVYLRTSKDRMRLRRRRVKNK